MLKKDASKNQTHAQYFSNPVQLPSNRNRKMPFPTKRASSKSTLKPPPAGENFVVCSSGQGTLNEGRAKMSNVKNIIISNSSMAAIERGIRKKITVASRSSDRGRKGLSLRKQSGSSLFNQNFKNASCVYEGAYDSRSRLLKQLKQSRSKSIRKHPAFA